jgi:hypothetical protein
MGDFDPTYAKEQILNKTDEELVLIANSTSSEYRQEVIDYAKEELQKRGAMNISTEKAQEIIEQRGEERLKGWIKEKEKGLPIKWLWFYIYVRLPFSFLLTLISIFFIPDLAVRVITLIITTPFAILCVLVFVGLHKRRIWGWKLNWVLIGFEMVLLVFREAETASSSIPIFLSVILWVVPNSIYFSKRRILFS